MRNILNVLEFNICLNPRMFHAIWRSAHTIDFAAHWNWDHCYYD